MYYMNIKLWGGQVLRLYQFNLKVILTLQCLRYKGEWFHSTQVTYRCYDREQ